MSARVAEAGRRRERRRLRITPRASVLVLVMVALSLYMVVPLRTYAEQRARLSRLERQTAVLQQENARLRREIGRLQDPAHVERMARCLGMVKPGEIGFVVVPEGDTQAPIEC